MKTLPLCFIVFLFQAIYAIDGNLTLVMVHALWRHGDRTPTETYHNDKFTVDYWKYGGGGWGQLTPIGMKQHMILGRKIRDRYINGHPYNFLKPQYDQQEVFVRATDKNRTLLSAASNMIGMYSAREGENFNRPGDDAITEWSMDLHEERRKDMQYRGEGPKGDSAKRGCHWTTIIFCYDFPEESGWPVGYVPIPIHTIDDAGDHLLDVDNACPLQDTVWELAKTTSIVSNYFNSENVTALMRNLTNFCGEDINPENLWILFNALKIEKQYFPEVFQNFTPWYTDALWEQIDIVNSQVQDFQNGLGLEGVVVKGIDIGRTLRKIRGGTLVNDIYNRMNRKAECLINTSQECAYTNNLKFFAYSAHDTTLYALFSLLDVAHFAVQPRGYPLYSACVLIEQWQDLNTNKTYFKMLYHKDENDTLENVITSHIKGCSGDYCDITVLKDYSENFKPDMEMNQWCNFDILKGSSSTSSIFASILVFLFSFVFIR